MVPRCLGSSSAGVHGFERYENADFGICPHWTEKSRSTMALTAGHLVLGLAPHFIKQPIELWKLTTFWMGSLELAHSYDSSLCLML